MTFSSVEQNAETAWFKMDNSNYKFITKEKSLNLFLPIETVLSEQYRCVSVLGDNLSYQDIYLELQLNDNVKYKIDENQAIIDPDTIEKLKKEVKNTASIEKPIEIKNKYMVPSPIALNLESDQISSNLKWGQSAKIDCLRGLLNI